MAKAVIGGVLQHVSASQQNTWVLCPRKHWYQKVAGLPEPVTPNLETGTQVHGQMEDYFLNGVRPAYESARILIDDFPIPKPGPGLLIEYPKDKVLGIKAAGVPVSGAIDLVDEREVDTEGVLNIWDWKTTKTLKFAKTRDQLLENLQLNTYGKWAFTHYGDRLRYVRYHHGNIQTSSPAAKVVSTDRIGREHVEEQFAAIESTVEQMKQTVSAPTAQDVPANKSACWEFNKPCPYLNKCQAADAGSFHAAFSAALTTSPTPEVAKEHEPVTSLKERIAARKAQQSSGTESAPAPVGAVGINPPDAAKPAPIAPAEGAKTTGPAPTPTVTPSPSAVASGIPPGGATSPTPTPAPGAFSATLPTTGLTLLVDCHGVKGIPAYTLLEEEIARRAEPIAKAAGVSDVRQVKFGEGTAALVASFLREPPSGVVLAYSGGLSQAVVEALTPVAGLVIRGSR